MHVAQSREIVRWTHACLHNCAIYNTHLLLQRFSRWGRGLSRRRRLTAIVPARRGGSCSRGKLLIARDVARRREECSRALRASEDRASATRTRRDRAAAVNAGTRGARGWRRHRMRKGWLRRRHHVARRRARIRRSAAGASRRWRRSCQRRRSYGSWGRWWRFRGDVHASTRLATTYDRLGFWLEPE